MRENFSNFISNPKKLFTLVAIILIALAIPITVITLQKQQETQQHAALLNNGTLCTLLKGSCNQSSTCTTGTSLGHVDCGLTGICCVTKPSTSPSPSPSCAPPVCLSANPPCEIPIPAGGWCNYSPSPSSSPNPGMYNFKVSGFVYIDANSNGTKDASEKGFPVNWTDSNVPPPISMFGSNGNYVLGVGTDNLGAYSIDSTNASGGQYNIKFQVPSGYLITKGSNNVFINVTSSTTYTVDFGIIAVNPTTPPTISPSPSGLIYCVNNPNICPSGTTCRCTGAIPSDPNQPTPDPATSCACGPINSGNTVLSFNLGLDGIGTAIAGGNTNPNTPTRILTVEIYKAGNQLVETDKDNIYYNDGTGRFTGDIHLGQDFTSGSYQVKVKTPGYLKKDVGQIVNIVSGQSNQMAQVNLTAGDIVDNNAIDIMDYNVLMSCSVFSTSPGACNANPENKYKNISDLNDDGKVDQSDYILLLKEWQVQNGD